MGVRKAISAYLVSGAAILLALAMATPALGAGSKSDGGGGSTAGDYDPLVDLQVTVTIDEIRALDRLFTNEGNFWWVVEIGSLNADGVLVWTVNESMAYRYYDGWEEAHLYPDWSFTADVVDSSSQYWFVITLYNEMWMDSGSEICDISRDEGGGPDYPADSSNVEFSWNPKYGVLWGGDDSMSDQNGQFHVSGIEDGSFGYENDENDCELFYSITWNDYDGDGLTYWEEVNTYLTNPRQSNLGWDIDGDGLPIEYEDFYSNQLSDGDSSDNLTDYDKDGLTAAEEYLFRGWGTAVDCPDILIEIDYREGYEPNAWIVDNLEKYFANYQLPGQDWMAGFFGANVVADVDDQLTEADADPNDNGCTDNYELDYVPYPGLPDHDILSTWFTAGREGSWRYCLMTNYVDEYQEYGGWTIGTPPRAFMVAAEAIDDEVDEHNWIHLLHDNIYLPHAVFAVLLHELGHNLDIYDRVDGQEVYCADPSCVMSAFDCCEFSHIDDFPNGPRYCDHHWSQLDLDVWATDTIQ